MLGYTKNRIEKRVINMDLDRLSEFLVIVCRGSVKIAANELGIAPNVLSTRLKAFERSLGVDLIRRNAHTFELTEAGYSLLKDADGLMEQYERMVSSVHHLSGATYQSLKLLPCGQFLAPELGPFLDRYCREHPRLFLDLYDENAAKIREGLQSGAIDLAFALGREGDFSDVSGRILLNVFPKMKVHVPNDHPLAKRTGIRFQELSGETFILYPNMLEPCTRELQRSMLERSGISYQIYEGNTAPVYFDLLVPISKGIRLWNWNDRLAPNTSLLTIEDDGYETQLFCSITRSPKIRQQRNLWSNI